MFGRSPYYLSAKDEQDPMIDAPLPKARRKGGDKPKEQVLRSIAKTEE